MALAAQPDLSARLRSDGDGLRIRLERREALLELQNGTRSEQVLQAEAAVAAAQANVDALNVDVARTRITAPRRGRG